MVGARRLLLAFLTVSVLHLAAAACMIFAVHSGLMARYFVACAALSALVGVFGFHLLSRPPLGGGGDGGAPTRRPDGPEPAWWPEFEREFWRHVDASPRTPTPP